MPVVNVVLCWLNDFHFREYTISSFLSQQRKNSHLFGALSKIFFGPGKRRRVIERSARSFLMETLR
jgi:hypothetical protein